MKYELSIEAPQQQYLHFSVTIETPDKETLVFLPTWRPGRYQKGDFAKNIKAFTVFDAEGKKCSFHKTHLSQWLIDTSTTDKIKINYKYYAAELNAGSTFLDDTQLYVNPVNCFIYTQGEYDKTHEVILNIPDQWNYAGPLAIENNHFRAKHFDELADSPFICSADLQHESYKVGATTFHIWFNGLVVPDWKRLISDFEAFTSKQIEKFIEFPTNEYHFLFQILPFSTYHGVEHSNCTVITLGPSYAVFEELYKELLGVSSHELYHTWNVKSIRPIEMVPYDFSTENFSELGYLSEGVTTYQGDLMLLKSGVFSLNQYLNELNTQLQKHFDNFGRFNYSVAESSFDTWLDGYEAGAPGRKVSIYTEGCLLAFVLDINIMKCTDNQKGLDEAMRYLYFNYGRKGIGVTRKDFQDAMENTADGADFNWLFEQYFHGTKAFETVLADSFDYLGLELNLAPSDDWAAAELGLKTTINDGKTIITAIFPGSSGDMSGAMIGDEIVAVNDIHIKGNISRWCKFLSPNISTITVMRKGKQISCNIPTMDRTFYQRYWLTEVDAPDKNQQHAMRWWRK